MKLTILIAFLVLICSTLSAQDNWTLVPAFPSGCYSQKDDYQNALNKVKDDLKKKIEEKTNAIKQKAESMSDEEKMKISMQYTNMTPDEIVKMQQEQMEMMTLMQTVQEKGTEIMNRLNEIDAQYDNEFAAKLGPIETEMRKLPDGEGTPAWAIEKGEELTAQYTKEYEALCAKYLTGENAVYKTWLADYKKYLLEYDIPYANKMNAMQYKQFNLTYDESITAMEAVVKYLDYCHTIFGKRRPYSMGG